MSDPDREALIGEIDAQLSAISRDVPGVCGGHGPMCRAIATLLRCQRAQLRQRSELAGYAIASGGVASAVLIAIVEFFREGAQKIF